MGADFADLSATQLDALLIHAEEQRIDKHGPQYAPQKERLPPPNLRTFHDLLQRRAKVRRRKRHLSPAPCRLTSAGVRRHAFLMDAFSSRPPLGGLFLLAPTWP